MRIKLIIAPLLIMAALLCFAFNGNSVSERIIRDSSQIYSGKISGRSLELKRVFPSASTYRYSFNGDICSFTVRSGKAYILSYSDIQEDVCYLSVFNKSSKVREDVIINSEVSDGDNIIIDNEERLFLRDKSGYVRAYQSGRKVFTSNSKYHTIALCGNKVIGGNRAGLFNLSGGERLISSKINNYFFVVDSNYIASGNQGLLRLSDNRLLNIYGAENKICVTDKYIVTANSDTLQAYEKSSGAFFAENRTEQPVKALICNSNRLYTVSGENHVSKYKITDVFKQDVVETASEPVEKRATAIPSSEFNLGKYKADGEYITIERGKSKTAFKNEINSGNYNCEFQNVTQHIGTGDTVTFKNGSKTLKYTFIINGDITGEGNINSRDIDKMFSYLLEIEKPEGVFFRAADISGDNKITALDLLKLARLRNQA